LWTGVLLGAAGCQSPSVLSDFRPAPLPVATITANGGAKPKELPPDQTARLCQAAAQDLERAGNIPEAIQLYEKARQTEPKLSDIVCRRLAVLYDFVGDFRHAQDEYDRCLKLNPRDPDLLNDYGYSCYCRGSWSDAELNFRKALALNPKHERAWINLGLTLGQQGRCDESIQAFTKVVSPAQAYANIAFVHLTQGQVEKAKVFYQLALARDPQLDLPNQVLARLDYKGDPELESIAPGARSGKRSASKEKNQRPALAPVEGAERDTPTQATDSEELLQDAPASEPSSPAPSGS
jgi:Tfp pilus assembly protein PilF